MILLYLTIGFILTLCLISIIYEIAYGVIHKTNVGSGGYSHSSY